jgi:hypothetical protein
MIEGKVSEMSGPVEPDPARSDAAPPPSTRMRPKRGAALVLALSGLAMVVGSSLTWHYDSSGILMSIVAMSGFDLAHGLLVAEIGLVLTLVGLSAVRRAGASPFGADSFALAVVALLIVGAYAIQLYGGPVSDGGPVSINYGQHLGVYVVALAAAMAAVASRRLRPANEAQRTWARQRRPALALLIIAAALWWLAVSGLLGSRAAPFTFAIVLLALAVGLWPTRLSATRVAPATIGVLMVLYGALALGAVVFWDVGPGHLAASPIALLVVVAVPAVLELPVDTPWPRPNPDRIDIALRAVVSTTGLKIAALLLTAVTVLLVGLAAIGFGDPLLRIRLIDDGQVAGADLLPMLVLGLAITGVIATDVLRRHGRGRGTLAGLSDST